MTHASSDQPTRDATRPAPWWQPLAVGIVAVAAVVVIAAVDPHEAGHYPTCPSLYLTGFWCPGCGSLRAIHDLAHADLVGALGMNILTVVAVPFLVWRWALWFARTLGYQVPRRLAPAWMVWALLATIVAFTIARNIPALGPWLAP